MKSIDGSIVKLFIDFNLYRNELDKIIEILNFAEPESLEIIANDYPLENIDDLASDKFKKIETLEINSENPSVSIKYNGVSIFLYARGKKYENIGICSELEKVIIETRSPNIKTRKKVFFFLLIFISILYLGITIGAGILNSKILFMTLVLPILGYLIYLLPPINTGFIYNYYPNAKTSFWVRHKEKIIGLIYVMLGVLVKSLTESFLR